MCEGSMFAGSHDARSTAGVRLTGASSELRPGRRAVCAASRPAAGAGGPAPCRGWWMRGRLCGLRWPAPRQAEVSPSIQGATARERGDAVFPAWMRRAAHRWRRPGALRPAGVAGAWAAAACRAPPAGFFGTEHPGTAQDGPRAAVKLFAPCATLREGGGSWGIHSTGELGLPSRAASVHAPKGLGLGSACGVLGCPPWRALRNRTGMRPIAGVWHVQEKGSASRLALAVARGSWVRSRKNGA